MKTVLQVVYHLLVQFMQIAVITVRVYQHFCTTYNTGTTHQGMTEQAAWGAELWGTVPLLVRKVQRIGLQLNHALI